MAVFAVIPKEGAATKLVEKIKLHPHLEIRKNLWLIDAQGTAQEVSEMLGVTSQDVENAIILKVSSYYGRATTNIWDWVQTHWT